MYTVQKFARGQVIDETPINIGSIGWEAKDTCFVVMKGGKPVYVKNRLSGKMELESYARKSTAELVAKSYNEKA